MKYLQFSLTTLILSSCTIQVKTYQKPTIDFSQYESWCWLEGCEATYQGSENYYSQKTIDRIANAVAYNMHEKGYVQEGENTDLLVNFFMILEEDSVDISTIRDGGYNEYQEPWLPNLYPEYQRFLRGSFIIDIIDRKQSELIWRSNTVRYLETNPKIDEGAIWKGVAKAMKKLPKKQLDTAKKPIDP